MSTNTLSIPVSLPSGRLAAATIYRDLGLAVHPLRAPDDQRVPEKERGKAPLLSGWRKWRAEDATNERLTQYFGNGSRYNLGFVVRPPLVVIDLDSKADNGASASTWLQQQNWLNAAPRERTAGGFHIYLECPDFPLYQPGAKTHGKALVVVISDQVTAELFFDGTNVVVAPSTHRSGHQYRWEVTGPVPTILWRELQTKIGFSLPANECRSGSNERKPGRPAKTPPWHTAYQGDLKTLDVIGLCQNLHVYGGPINTDERKHSITCPWRAEHSGSHGGDGACDTSTAVFEPTDDGSIPGFVCLHAHCSERHIREFLGWCEQQEKGVVDRFCKRQRVYTAGQAAEDGRPCVVLPGVGRPESEFATDVGKVLGAKAAWFNHGERPVEVQLKRLTENVKSFVFHPLQPAEVITRVDEYLQAGHIKRDEAGNDVFIPNSMSEKTARVLVNSRQLTDNLPRVVRVLPISMPVFDDAGRLVFPQPGYDPRFQTYTDPLTPKLSHMDLRAAKMWLSEVLRDFPFESSQSLTHAIARIMTPAARGLMGWDAKVPFWIFLANRERLGKDCLNGISSVLYDGFPNEDAPLEPRNTGETRKRITAALIAGRARMHFANCRGYIQDAALEQAITSRVWSDRLLGGSTDIRLPNELEFSMSGNLGISYTADIANRCRRIVLYYEGENPNSRRFSHPDIYSWVRTHRAELLSAVMALIENWVEVGKPAGTTAFSSFPEWARTVGGIMQAAELGDPCLPDASLAQVGGDEETGDMKILFQLAHEKWGPKRVELSEIIELITEGE